MRMRRAGSSSHDATKPGGVVWIVDSLNTRTTTSPDQSTETNDETQKRILKDGREYEVIKIYYDVPSLTHALERNGFSVDVRATENYFVHAVARRPID